MLKIQKRPFYTFIIVLQLITASVLGFLIIQRIFFTKGANEGSASQEIVDSGADLFENAISDSGISWNEKNIIDEAPNSQAPDEQRQDHYNAALKLAKDDLTIEIVECKGSPAVAKINQNSNLEFINKSSTEISIIVYSKDKTYKIPANGQISITTNFGKGLGLYSYGCGQNPGPAGFIFVSE